MHRTLTCLCSFFPPDIYFTIKFVIPITKLSLGLLLIALIRLASMMLVVGHTYSTYIQYPVGQHPYMSE
jgi:hypothetical protein